MGYVTVFVLALSLGTFLGILLTHFKSHGIIKVTGADEDGIYLGLVVSKSPEIGRASCRERVSEAV